MDYSLLIAYLRQKQYITDLERIFWIHGTSFRNPHLTAVLRNCKLCRITQNTRRFLPQSRRYQQRLFALLIR